jgi:hypothetical protein
MESISKRPGSRSIVSGDPVKVHSSLELLAVLDEAGKYAAGWRKQSVHESGESCKFSGEAPEPSFSQRRPEISCRPEKFIDDSTKTGDSDAAFDVICIWILVFPKEPERQDLFS